MKLSGVEYNVRWNSLKLDVLRGTLSAAAFGTFIWHNTVSGFCVDEALHHKYSDEASVIHCDVSSSNAHRFEIISSISLIRNVKLSYFYHFCHSQ